MPKITRVEFLRVSKGWTAAVYRDADPFRTEYIGATWKAIIDVVTVVVKAENKS